MSIRLLIADDIDAIRENIKSFLSKQPDIEVVGEAKDGVTAVELAKKLSPDVVLMDINMPKMNGIEATRRIKENHRHIPIIIQTAFTQPKDRQNAQKAGCDGFISKPIIKDKLFEILCKFISNT